MCPGDKRKWQLTMALSQKPNFAFPCRIFRPAERPTRWTQLTLVSTTSRLLQDGENCSSGPPFYTNDLMRNLDQGDPIIDVDSVLSGFVHCWPEAELKRSQYIGLGAWCEQRNLPTFILYVPRNAKTRASKDVRVHSDVILCSALGKIAPVNFSVAEFHADFLSRTQPIVHPG